MNIMKQTKKARTERAREIIDRNDYGIPFNQEDLLEFSAVTGCELRYACRAIDPNYPTNDRHVEVIAYDWDKPRGWSWSKAIRFGQQDLERHHRAQLYQAMREVIRPQIEGFFERAEKACEVCVTTEALTVDHAWPPFLHLVMGYINDHGVPQIEPDNGSGFKFSHWRAERRWDDYHHQNAKLAILCRSCNSRKGAREL
jgi:5-methylcytosine-specific restriction endonuclease McrA